MKSERVISDYNDLLWYVLFYNFIVTRLFIDSIFIFNIEFMSVNVTNEVVKYESKFMNFRFAI